VAEREREREREREKKREQWSSTRNRKGRHLEASKSNG